MPMQTNLFWTASLHESALVATLSRPDVRNAMNRQCWTELDGMLEHIEATPAIRVLVITGGDSVFSAGGDMKDAEPSGDGVMKNMARLELAQKVLARLSALPIPVIAVVSGPAAGIGWSLALACDFLVADQSAKFFAPFSKRSLIPDGGISGQLCKTVGRFRATSILLLGEPLSAEEALGLGLVSAVTPQGHAMETALAMVQKLSATSRDCLMLSLKLIRSGCDATQQEIIREELISAALNSHSPDVALARQAFSQSR